MMPGGLAAMAGGTALEQLFGKNIVEIVVTVRGQGHVGWGRRLAGASESMGARKRSQVGRRQCHVGRRHFVASRNMSSRSEGVVA